MDGTTIVARLYSVSLRKGREGMGWEGKGKGRWILFTKMIRW
jgi:hypothetical protein